MDQLAQGILFYIAILLIVGLIHLRLPRSWN